MSFSYRMTEEDIRKLIELRAANSAIFTGQRHSAMRGWRAIRQELGLEGMISARQLKKKWDNLKEKYRVLKNPPAGMERPGPPSWHWFQLMDEAASGHLASGGKLLEPSVEEGSDDNSVPHFTFGDLAVHAASIASDEEAEACGEVVITETTALRDAHSDSEEGESFRRNMSAADNVLSVDVSEMSGEAKSEVPADPGGQPDPNEVALYATPLPEGLAPSDDVVAQSCGSPVEHKLQRDKQEPGPRSRGLESDRVALQRERAALERDRTALERDRAVLERDRAALERDRAAFERDRVCLDRDRAFVERDRAFLERDRAILDRAQEEAARAGSPLTDGKEIAESGQAAGGDGESPGIQEGIVRTRFCQNLMAIDVGPEQLESTQRLMSLFSKLVDKL